MRRALPLLLAVAACSAESQLVVSVMNTADCEAYCVDTLRITFDGRTDTLTCGTAANLGSLATGRTHTIVAQAEGRGSPLVFTAEVTPIEGEDVPVSFDLAPQSRPRIDAVTPERDVLIGRTRVEATGTGFGPGEGDSVVLVDGEAVNIESWSDDSVVFETSRAGEVTVQACGVPSEAALLDAAELQFETFTLDTEGCGAPHLIGADVVGDGTNGIRGVLQCEAPCRRNKLVEWDGDTGRSTRTFDVGAGCPLDLAMSSTSAANVVILAMDDEPGRVARFVERSDGAVARTDHLLGFNFRRVSADASVSVLLGSRWRPWAWDFAEGTFPLVDQGLRATDAYGRYVLTERSAERVLAAVGPGGIDDVIAMTCANPERIARGAPRANEIYVICDDGIEVWDATARARTARLAVSDRLAVEEAAVTRDGVLVVIVTEDDGVVFAHLDEGWITRVELPAQGGRRELIRAETSDRFFVTGDTPGSVVRIDLEGLGR
ncbi:MAG: IPT/TIG domain-containing protein [Deltaproteobacteria bacterium]